LELPKSKFIVTPAGYEKLRKELEELESRRVQVSRNIKTAKGYGDLKENFEYHEAKREQGFVEGRIMELKIILPGAHVVQPEDIPTDYIGFGSLVRLKDLEYDDELDYAVVGSLEADPDQDRISYESPLGQALLRKKVGDEVEVRVPAGITRYEIVAIDKYLPPVGKTADE
jgi:transcription elongation factor GreA